MKDKRKLSWVTLFAGFILASLFAFAINSKQAKFNEERKEETLLRTTLVNSDAAVIVIDKEGLIVMTTPQLNLLTGYTSEELIGKSAHILMPPAYRAAHDKAYGDVTNGRSKSSQHVLCQVRRKDGSNVSVINNVFAYADGGVAILTPAAGMFVEQQLHLMALETARVGVWWWEVEADRLVWDATMCAIFGITELDMVPSYAGFEQLVHPEDREWLSRKVQRCLETREPYRAVFRVGNEEKGITYVRAYGNVFDSPAGVIFAGVNIRTTADEYTGNTEL